MVKDFERVRKGWPFDIFWRRKLEAIRELKDGDPSEPPPRRHMDDALVLVHVQRLIAGFEKSEKARRYLFVKLVLAWLIAYGLTMGEVPWFLSQAWAAAEWAGTWLFNGFASGAPQ